MSHKEDQDVKEVPMGDDKPLDPEDPKAQKAMHEEFEEAKEDIGADEDND